METLTGLGEWAKFGLLGMVIGSLFMLLAVIIVRVMPAREKSADAREKSLVDAFVETSKAEREQCAKQFETSLEMYRDAVESSKQGHEKIAEMVTAMHTEIKTRHAIEDERRRINGREERRL